MATTTPTTNASGTSERPPICSIHHTALRCFDAEETRRFYEDILGLQMTAVQIMADDGLGNAVDFCHIFFRMGDGDFVAFFDLADDIKPEFWNHYDKTEFRKGLKVSTETELLTVAKRLSAAGIKYTGPVDHGFVKSIYFKDPNGINIEIAASMPRHDEILAEEKKRARAVLAEWTAKTAARKANSAVKRPSAAA